MAQNGDQYGYAQNMEFGTQPARDHGRNVAAQAVGTGATDTYQQLHEQQHGQKEKLHRTGSSSSSSSKDNGEGGRRKKKRVTQKIKEKIPGVGKKEKQQSHDTSHNTIGTMPLTGDEVDSHENKNGVMDKIMDKLTGVT